VAEMRFAARRESISAHSLAAIRTGSAPTTSRWKIQEIREANRLPDPDPLKLVRRACTDDVRMAENCGPDIIYLDGAEGGHRAGRNIAAAETAVPAMAAIPEARRALERTSDLPTRSTLRGSAVGIPTAATVAKCVSLERRPSPSATRRDGP